MMMTHELIILEHRPIDAVLREVGDRLNFGRRGHDLIDPTGSVLQHPEHEEFARAGGGLPANA